MVVNKNNNSHLIKNGFIDYPLKEDLNLAKEINLLKKEKNAVILAHFYQEPEVQEIADFVGDSLALSQKAADTNADIIVFAGVHFMAETAKILSPKKKVLLPDLNAGCSLADSCPDEDFKEFIKKNPGHVVITYVNSSANIKAMSDIICTSSNAELIVNSVDSNKKILFAPDKNLGEYISKKVGREMLLWNGACHVHEEFSLEGILNLKKQFPQAKIIAHPECKKHILIVSDYIGSTADLLKFVQKDDGKEYIVVTESGILHQMRKKAPEKNFIPAPPSNSNCACNDCIFMKKINLKKIYLCLKHEMPEIELNEDVRLKAEKPIRKMLELSKSLTAQ